MQSAKDEQYVFLRFAHADVEHAIRSIDEYDQALPVRAGYALLQMAVVAYMRPFNPSDTVFEHPQPKGPARRKIRLLRDDFVPSSMIELHDELARYRDCAYAHTDLDKRKPRLAYWPSSSFTEFPIGFTPIDAKPLHLHVGPIRALMAVVRDELIRRMRVAEAIFREELPSEGPEDNVYFG